jgi:hypothetical protein
VSRTEHTSPGPYRVASIEIRYPVAFGHTQVVWRVDPPLSFAKGVADLVTTIDSVGGGTHAHAVLRKLSGGVLFYATPSAEGDDHQDAMRALGYTVGGAS